MSGLTASMTVRRDAFEVALDLEVAPGEVVALLGPNGAGKSTVLRALAGLLPVSAGTVSLGGELVEQPERQLRRAPYARSCGVVFQDYLLFPHLTVLDNVAFGPRSRGADKASARRAARPWLERVGVAELADRRPAQISGGQAQRVALARALATEPTLLLLDEPLAALDARTRLRVRGELRRHLQQFAGAAVVVTHDPVDAAVLADRLVVLEAGRVVQEGTAAEVARRPRTDYVARLVGLNLFRGVVADRVVRLGSGIDIVAGSHDLAPATDAFAAFAPAAVSLFGAEPLGSPRNRWRGRVLGLEPYGDAVRVEVGGVPEDTSTVVAEVTQAAVLDLDLVVGSPVWAVVKASEVAVYPA